MFRKIGEKIQKIKRKRKFEENNKNTEKLRKYERKVKI